MRHIPHRPVRAALIGALVTGSLVAASAALIPSSATSDGFDRSVLAKKSDRTPFAYRAVTYGSRVRGGAIPASSGTTSYQAIGCTNVAGVDKTNEIASIELPGLGVAKGVDTRSWTERSNGVYSSYSTHDIARIVLGRGQLRRAGHPGPELVLAGLLRQHRLPRGHQDTGRQHHLHAHQRGAAGPGDPDPGPADHHPGTPRDPGRQREEVRRRQPGQGQGRRPRGPARPDQHQGAGGPHRGPAARAGSSADCSRACQPPPR